MAILSPPHPDSPPPPMPIVGGTPPANPRNGGSWRPPTPQPIPDILETNYRETMIIETPPKIGINPVFRITSVPFHATKQELLEILMEEFRSEKAILPNTSRLVMCSSCYDDRSQTALVEFIPRAPSVLLSYLKDKSNKGYMIPLPGGGDITIDQDFHGLTKLYPTNGPIKADIVAVCGLNGHAYGSWSSKADNRGIKRMWLRDFLHEDLPACRTMIYGYDSRLTGARGLQAIPDYTDVFLEELKKARRAPEENIRPIVFIGHSFGAIIIAEAIVKAKGNIDKYGGLFESTKATIFYATPQRGLVVDDILSMIGDDSTREDVVKSLRHRSEGELHNFKNCTSPYGLKIISYKESEQIRKLIKDENGEWARKGELFNAVLEESAVFHLPAYLEETLVIEGDHSTLVKFQYKAQPSYTSALRHLEACTNDTGVGRYMTPESVIINGSYQDLAHFLQVTTLNVNAPLEHLQGTTTLLHVATLTNDVSKVHLLLEKGSDIDALDEHDHTALHHAIVSNNVKMVELLLQSGAKSPRREDFPDTNMLTELPLLHFACVKGNPEMVEYLLKSGGTSLEDCAGYYNEYPLHFAAKNESSSILEILLVRKEVDTEVKDRYGWTALHRAAAYGRERNIRSLLLSGANIEARDRIGATPLHIAVEYMRGAAVVDALLENHADITAKDHNGDTPLHFACREMNKKLAKRFLDHGADIEIRNSFGMTPLQTAASVKNGPVAKSLLRNGASTTTKNEGGETPLHTAIMAGSYEVVKHLLDHKADVQARVKEGDTPLHIAAGFGNEEMVQLLLEHKADRKARNFLNALPIDMAKKEGNLGCVGLLA